MDLTLYPDKHTPTAAVTIRPATPADVTRVVEMAQTFLGSTAYGRLLRATDASLTALFEVVLGMGAVFVAEIEIASALVGMIAIVCGPHPITGEVYGEELAWWVEPDHRHSTIGPQLLDTAEAWARARGVTMLKMVAPAGSDIGSFYERHGYQVVETAYQKTMVVETASQKTIQ